jgi:hypothetical protein
MLPSAPDGTTTAVDDRSAAPSLALHSTGLVVSGIHQNVERVPEYRVEKVHDLDQNATNVDRIQRAQVHSLTEFAISKQLTDRHI